MNTLRIASSVAAFAAMTVMGLAVGWFARSQTMAGADPQAQAPAVEGAKPEQTLSQRALQNMGVTRTLAAKSDYTVCREVLAVIEELPTSQRSVSARWGGTVLTVFPAGPGSTGADAPPSGVAGRLVKPGETVLEILRAPLPRLSRTLTGDVVQMVSETVHDALVQLHSARQLHELAKVEYERVRELNQKAPEGLPLIARQTEINLQYETVKARTEIERLEGRLLLHGFTLEQIRATNASTPLVPSADVWKRALERNGLWPATGEQMLAKLPESLKTHAWTYAALGELSALGLCGEALVNAVTGEPQLGARFLEAAALMQEGHSLEDVMEMVRSGALDPVIRVTAPQGAPLWEIRELKVKQGEKVEAGGVLAVLVDNRRVSLELEANGEDAAVVEDALRNGVEMEGRPLVAKAGPTLKKIKLRAYNMPCAADAAREPRAYAIIENERLELPESNGTPPTGAWHLREGMRYRVLVPTSLHRSVFVLPREAVVAEGAEKVVFLESGTSYRRQSVRLLHEDRESVVVADDGAIFSGDPVVTSGAFALSLALRAEATGGASGAHDKHGPTCAH
jgi:hypothetical protein